MQLCSFPAFLRALSVASCAALFCAPAQAAQTAPLTSGLAASAEMYAPRLGPALSGTRIDLLLPLAADYDGLRRLALTITTPGSPQYHQYRSLSWLTNRYGASDGTKHRVVQYLKLAGAGNVSVDPTGLFVNATLPAGRAERLFSSPLSEFRAHSGARFLAPDRTATIPTALRGLITGVVGLDSRPIVTADPQLASAHPDAQQPSGYFPASGTAGGCAAGRNVEAFTPNQYLTAYGYTPLHSHGLAGQKERIALLELDGFRSHDLRTFARCFGLHVPPVHTYKVGLRHAPPPGSETTLDTEIIDAAAPDLASLDIYEIRAQAADFIRSLTAPLNHRRRIPQVISTSLGICEPELLAVVGPGGIAAADAALEIAAVRGVSFVAATGDTGSTACVNGRTPVRQLAVSYPASSWFATAVGGTNITLDVHNAITQQLVWNDTTLRPGRAGGGGFSNFSRPPYQDRAVSEDSRGVPDVAMLADVAPGYSIYCTTSPCPNISSSPWLRIGGTSASAPLLAGGFALVDQDLRLHHRTTLGLANPLLYGIGASPTLSSSVFNDVVAHNNDVGPYFGDHAPMGCCRARSGYDEASGWGSVNLASFASAAVQNEPPIFTLSLPAHQHPLSGRAILARISCGGPCRVAAAAQVKVGRAQPFILNSFPVRLASAGSRTVELRFSARQIRAMRRGLHRHKKVSATVFALLLNAKSRVLRETSGTDLTITS